MTIKPILFSAQMVLALLGGQKTQTRRVLKPVHGVKPPYEVGDLLWVREAWRTVRNLDPLSPVQIVASSLDAGYGRAGAPIQYEADGARDNWIADPHTFGEEPGRRRAGMHMPRPFSRLTLRVTHVLVQRLQDAGWGDLVEEGIRTTDIFRRREAACLDGTGPCGFVSRESFAELWDSLNAARGFGWDANPWAAAYTFEVIRKNVAEVT